MKNALSVVHLLWIIAALGVGCIVQAQQANEAEIFRIELVTRLDAIIEGGGFEQTASIDRRLVKDVRNCIGPVREVAIGWGTAERFVLAREDSREASLILHFERPREKGIYEVAYRVNVSSGYATGGFKFYDPTGSIQSGPTGSYPEFSAQLRKAMLCK